MKDESKGLCVVLSTAPDESLAAELARGLVEGGLAACVQVLSGVRSFYIWEGKLQDDAEWLLIAKTHPSKLEALQAWIEANHPYELPECVVLRGEASARYAAWVGGAIGNS